MRMSSLWKAATFVAAVAAVFATPRQAQAQTGKIAGVVTDAATGQPIEGVQVRVSGTGFGALTQSNGRYFIISVPPGTYTVQARRIGYQTVEVANVTVAIDITRTQDFRLQQATTQLTTQRIIAEATPLIEPGVTGSQTTIDAEQIQSLPVTNIAGVLSLQQGFTATPQNTSLQSLAEEQRSTVQPIRVRGGRGGATVTLVDGIPINNPLTGAEAISLNALAVSALDFVRGYMEPQYGNGLSGVINQATREGGTDVAGSLDFQSTALAGAMGSRPDELYGYNLFRGWFSGPVPGTATKLRYAVSGVVESSANRVLEFDQDVTSFNQQQVFNGLAPNATGLDLIPGWRAFGGRAYQQMLGKLTFIPRASGTTRLNLSAIDQQRQSLGYDRRYLLGAGGDPLNLVRTTLDSLGVLGNRGYRDLLQASVRDNSRLYIGSLEQRFGRSALQLRAARTEMERSTCNIFVGVCMEQPFILANFSESFWAPFGVAGVPYGGTSLVSGGEDYKTNTFRADLQSQVTDHHNFQLGASFLQHDIVYRELRGISGNSGIVERSAVVPQLYRAKPIEAATYLQDRIEYDFLTIKIGARYDYGRARGRGFADPLNPTNGTTVRDVCDNPTRFGLPANFSTVTVDGQTFTGYEGCTMGPKPRPDARSSLVDSAVRVAQRDDFKDAPARTAFSPRIGVSFPLTERALLFFNAGRYTMNPLYHNLYRNSGVGTVAGVDDFCLANETKPGSRECVPPLRSNNPDFIGNPNLRLEEATQYEIGYGGEFGRAYSINVAVYNRDETGLSGSRVSRAAQDVGTTYAGTSTPRYFTVVNQDFLTARGVEIQFRRRTTNFWGYDINYGWSRATTNSPPPDRAFEISQGGEINRTILREYVSEIDQTHRFNGTLSLKVQDRVPAFRFGSLLRNTSGSLTYRYSSGFPYTPIRGITNGAITNELNANDINSGRAPATQVVDALLQKSWRVTNVNYGLFVRVDNMLDIKNCVQVFVNTGTCDSGIREQLNRRVGNFNDASSTAFDQPEYYGQRRQIYRGITVRF
jgi:hypothetical protein